MIVADAYWVLKGSWVDHGNKHDAWATSKYSKILYSYALSFLWEVESLIFFSPCTQTHTNISALTHNILMRWPSKTNVGLFEIRFDH